MDDLAVLRMFHRLGIRYITLTWNNSNNWADSSEPDQSRYGNLGPHGGLTDFGKDVVKEMNRLGVIVDCSHVHDDTFWDVIEVSTKPIIISHSCCYALNDHNRNVKDDMLKALAKNGGVIGINFAPGFLSVEYRESSAKIRGELWSRYGEIRQKYQDDPEAQRAEVAKLRKWFREQVQQVPIGVLVDHIEHAAEIAGYDHIGLGSDFDGISDTPTMINDCTDLVYIVAELGKRGWSEENIRKFLGENFLRVIRENTGH
jgi:membrane dipeptidase